MNTKKTYSEKLKDPRWQKLRLEVMNANGFCCEICGDAESTLHVHHKEYLKGHEVWEYEVRQLSVVCESCHAAEHESTDILKMVCSYAPMDGPCNRSEIAFVIAGHLNIPFEKLIKESGMSDCTWTRAQYEAGMYLSRLSDHMFSVIK
ncbi:MAG: hypothetical protein Q8L80_07895 [Gallionella sp.]|nr:hypothetical protein [Gallionella sp.]MDP1941267.1 hypothetical protein [Gallionella sp.]